MITIAELQAKEGVVLGTSEWVTLSQERINTFADVTEDHQFIHLDAERAAAETDLGGTIAHGFLTLSYLSNLNSQIIPDIKNRTMTFNYGLNKVRFLHPVPAGAKIRSTVRLQSVTEKPGNRYLCQYGAEVEIENVETPALIAEVLVMYVVETGE